MRILGSNDNLKLFFSVLLSFAFFVIMGCESLDTWKKDFSRAVGWEKAEPLETEEVIIGPPLVLPPDYKLTAPKSGRAPEAHANNFPDQDLLDDSLEGLSDIDGWVTDSDKAVNRDRRSAGYRSYSKDGAHPSPSRNISYGKVNSIFKNALKDYQSTNYDSHYSRQYHDREYPKKLTRDNQTYSTEANSDLSRYKGEPKPIGEAKDGSLEEAQTCKEIRKDVWGEYVCVD